MNSSSNVRRRAQQLRRERARAQGQTNAGVLRLTVCGIIFVLLVAVKLLFPEAVSNIAQSAGRLIGRDADFKAAFAAVGRAISGEEPAAASLQDAYTAVFNPSQPDARPKPAEEPLDTPAPPTQVQPSAPAGGADGPAGVGWKSRGPDIAAPTPGGGAGRHDGNGGRAAVRAG